MFKDDISNIENGCAEYNGNSISVFDNGSFKKYRLNGRTWYLVETGSSDYVPSVCFDLSVLNSNARFSPFYGCVALFLVILVVGLVYKLYKPIFGGGYA